jgi:hypothetical protein
MTAGGENPLQRAGKTRYSGRGKPATAGGENPPLQMGLGDK